MIVKFRTKTIKIWERRGLFQNLHITEDKIDFDQQSAFFLKVLMLLEKKKRLPKNSDKIRAMMGNSYKNQGEAFMSRSQYADVLDIDYVLEQII